MFYNNATDSVRIKKVESSFMQRHLKTRILDYGGLKYLKVFYFCKLKMDCISFKLNWPGAIGFPRETYVNGLPSLVHRILDILP